MQAISSLDTLISQVDLGGSCTFCTGKLTTVVGEIKSSIKSFNQALQQLKLSIGLIEWTAINCLPPGHVQEVYREGHVFVPKTTLKLKEKNEIIRVKQMMKEKQIDGISIFVKEA
jgi:hypothetical protein